MAQPKNERDLAVNILTNILDANAYANIALRKALAEQYDIKLDPRGRAFITDLVNETLRNLILIDHVISKFSNTPIDKMKPFIRNLLRISVCQMRHMDKIPDRAAVNEAVNLVKAKGLANLSGFVNGVLRAISREEKKTVNDPALRYSYPKWLFNSIVNWLGEEDAIKFCENSHIPPSVIVRTNTVKTNTKQLVEELRAEGVVAEPIEHDFITLSQTGDISRLKSFVNGHFFVMDYGALAAVHALSPKPNQTILDICAAPGGKSFVTALLMENEGLIRAFDIHPHRVELVRQTKKKLGLSIIEPEQKDALVLDPLLVNSADAVLLDAPCTGFGTIRKHPEIKYNRTKQDIIDLAEKQRQMLDVAAQYVKNSGILVYCTCTIATEENINNINYFLSNNKNFKLDKTHQILPSSTSDGFYVARLIRIK